ncbi:hypothetical protein FE257_005681 [Aspergillus nanangensis]|uniref:Phosphatidylglycerol specific phospholipase n=1 Tax=Aspergillus nanangensis TaxID=2582783 RepID=A0AAD4CPY8_ASPNN|nr:hypothetical protein FE257_005681 [Aspergillus nanangensis]
MPLNNKPPPAGVLAATPHVIDYYPPIKPASRTRLQAVAITVLLTIMTVFSLGTFFLLSVSIHARPSSSPIKNVVVLVQENLSFDVFAGGLTYNPDIDGVVNHTYCNPANVSDPASPQVCAQSTAKNVAADDPDHSIAGGNQQVYSTYHPHLDAHAPSMQGFVSEQIAAYGLDADLPRAAEVINYYSPDHVPVFNALASNYVLFDRWFAAVPGPTNPNRAYLTSGTSAGHGANDNDFLTSSLPQVSIFQQLSAANLSWTNYSNTTDFLPDAQFYAWTQSSGAAATHVKPLDQFFADAAAGALPQFSWINPECCQYTSFHPPSPINMGEAFVKRIYDALRASPQWKDTLFVLTFDEHGGFADHVSPPEGVPPGDALAYSEQAPDGKTTTFRFDRLGVRVPTVLVSPWVGKGVVQGRPGGAGEGEFTHTSILKFVAELWGLDVLTPRVEWSASFGNLVTNVFRADAVERLPEPAGEW